MTNIDRVIQEWETDIDDFIPCEEIGSIEDYLEEREESTDGSND